MLISLACPPDVQDERLKVILTEVVDRELALALGSLVEHFPQLHHSVCRRTPLQDAPDQSFSFSRSQTRNLSTLNSPMLTSTVT
jgi:hypothetical protein